MLAYSREAYTSLVGKVLAIYRSIRSGAFDPDLDPASRVRQVADALILRMTRRILAAFLEMNLLQISWKAPTMTRWDQLRRARRWVLLNFPKPRHSRPTPSDLLHPGDNERSRLLATLEEARIPRFKAFHGVATEAAFNGIPVYKSYFLLCVYVLSLPL